VTGNARLRLAIVGVVAFSLFATLSARLWYLQVLDSDEFQAAASRNQVRVIYEAASRGRILDRQGRPLVEGRAMQAVRVNRLEMGQDPDVVNRLAALLGLSVDEMKHRIDDKRFTVYRPVPVAERVSEDLVVYIKERAHEFPGVDAAPISERIYPHGSLAAHVLGYVGEINDRELDDRKSKGYRLGDDIGKSGAEQAYEDDLRGTPGRTELEVDSKGKLVSPPVVTQQPVPGNDVQLTIDLDVQRLAEESLAQGLDAARKRSDSDSGDLLRAPAGSVVVMDPRDGSILAMASLPTYDPTAFVNGVRPELFQALQAPEGYFPLTNRAIQGQYAPGSTFKLFTALAALQTNTIKPATTFLDEGVFQLRNCRGDKCTWRNAGGARHGRVNVSQALSVSSDVFFYTLGANFWFQGGPNSQAIQAAARQLGLGEKTGIPLTGELKGRIPDPATRKRLNEANPKAFPNGRWYAGDNVNLAIGQGEAAVTPLQLANAYATFANGGSMFVPRVAARVLTPSGTPVREAAPQRSRQVPLPAHIRLPILQGLKGAVSDPKGTAASAFLDFPLNIFPVAGKTGTAQVAGKQDTSVFVAFAPADSPRYVVAVVMEESGCGGSAAAPVARRVLEGLAGSPPAPVRAAGAVD
jgi:penicillin-binding protein 2